MSTMSIESLNGRQPSFVKDSTSEWSLASDLQICELLKKMSSDMISEVTQVSHNVSEVKIESRQLSVLMQNVCNDLCMLANEQFIENLVEDVQGSGTDNKANEVPQTPKEENTTHGVIQCLQMGLRVLETQFEVMDITRLGSVSQTMATDTDLDLQTIHSVGDFPSNEPIYHPRDPYESRHLPHLIGTLEFIEDDTLGIGFIDDMEEEEEGPDKFQRSPSLSSQASDRKDYLTSSCSGSEDEAPGVKVNDLDSLHSEDLFETKSVTKIQVEDEDEHDATFAQKTQVPPKRLSLTDQLNEQLKARLNVRPSEEKVFDKRQETKTSREELTDPGKVVSSRAWSDDDEEDDIFTSALAKATKSGPTTKVTSNQSPKMSLPKSSVILEDDNTDSDDDMFNTKKSTIKTNTKGSPEIVPSAAPRKVSEKMSDTDDDMFKPLKPIETKTKNSPVIIPSKAPRKVSEKMSDTDDDMFKPLKTSIPSITKKEASPSSLKEVSKNKVTIIEELSDSDDIFKPILTNKKKLVSATMSAVKNTPDKEDGDDDDSIHLAKSKANTTKMITSSKKDVQPLERGPRKAMRPFVFSSDDDDDDLDDLFKVPSRKSAPVPSKDQKVPGSTVIEGTPDESLFGSTLPKNVPKKSEGGPSDLDPISKEPSQGPASLAMISENYSKVSPKRSPSLASESSDDTSLFENNHTPLKSSSKVSPNMKVLDEAAKVVVLEPLRMPLPFDPLSDVKIVSETLDEKGDLFKKGLDLVKEGFEESCTKMNQYHGQDQLFSDDEELFQRQSPTQINNSGLSRGLGGASSKTESESPPQRTSLFKPMAGAIPSFGGALQNVSLLDELKKRNRKKTDVEEDLVEEVLEVNDMKESFGVRDALLHSIIPSFPGMYSSPKEVITHTKNNMSSGSPDPEENDQVSLDTPAKVVTKLNNLTKTRARRRPSTKAGNNAQAQEVIKKEDPKPIVPKTEAVVIVTDDTNIFADLPVPEKKSKIKIKKDRTKVAPVMVDVDEIDDIFAIPSKKTVSKKKVSKTKVLPGEVVTVVDDPLLGPL